MLVDFAKKCVLSLTVALLAACGGGGGNPGIGVSPLPSGTGNLAITVANLPVGVAAVIKVTGPASFGQDVTQTQTLAGLAPGTYTIAAASVASAGISYAPTPATQTVSVAAGDTARATVSYGAAAALTLGLTAVATGLSDPVFLTAPAGDSRRFIVERGGRVRILQADGSLASLPFLDIGPLVSTTGEGGLLSMAFDPQYASNGHFFLYYVDTGENIVIERRSVSANPNLADPTSALQIIRIAHPNFTNHFGGLASFGPDGFLYLGTGDGGGAGDPAGNAQNLNVLLGKLLRLDVSAATVLQPYAIPPSNPFSGAGQRAEIWAYGLRNPWRYAFDGNSLYIADVGQDLREEVDIGAVATGGQNYGWDIMEGSACFLAATCDKTGLVLPAFEYQHGANDANGCSIVGGYVYRGAAIPELAGRYFYSDYCGGYLKSFFATTLGVTGQTDWAIQNPGQVQSFGRDADGELYLMAASGTVYKIVRTSAR